MVKQVRVPEHSFQREVGGIPHALCGMDAMHFCMGLPDLPKRTACLATALGMCDALQHGMPESLRWEQWDPLRGSSR